MPRLLAIDDSATVRKLIRVHLNGLGFLIDDAANGAEGLKLLAKNKYDLIILDLMMPVMDGLVMLRMKDALKNETPVIVLTAEVNEQLKLAMANPHVMDYVRKPLDANGLRVAVNQVMTLGAGDAPPT